MTPRRFTDRAAKKDRRRARGRSRLASAMAEDPDIPDPGD
jgi:hypothetical protein